MDVLFCFVLVCSFESLGFAFEDAGVFFVLGRLAGAFLELVLEEDFGVDLGFGFDVEFVCFLEDVVLFFFPVPALAFRVLLELFVDFELPVLLLAVRFDFDAEGCVERVPCLLLLALLKVHHLFIWIRSFCALNTKIVRGSSMHTIQRKNVVYVQQTGCSRLSMCVDVCSWIKRSLHEKVYSVELSSVLLECTL